MNQLVVDQLADRISTLLGQKLNVRGVSLERRFRRAGRAVPRRARRPIRTLIEAQQMAQNPQMAMRIDKDHLSKAYDIALRELSAIDEQSERARRRINLAALVALQILLIGGILVAVLRWRGFI